MLITSFDYCDTLAASRAFADDPYLAVLDSAAQDDKNHVSYLAADPFRVIEARRGGVAIDGQSAAGDFFSIAQRELARYREKIESAPAPFAGGAIGFLGYELGGCLERLPPPPDDDLDLATGHIAFYDVVAAFDHHRRKAWLFSSGWPETDSRRRNARAHMRADAFLQKLKSAPEYLPPTDWSLRADWQPELVREDVERCIAKIMSYIHAGDIFQANFTQRFRAWLPPGLDDFMLYRRLREASPSPFAAFLRAGPGLSVLGASPERFLRLDAGGQVLAQPIKGTRPRDADAMRDAALAAALRSSAKDRAENLMIVDLMRNDLSRVCALGSVQVPQLCALASFASVHHLLSAVTGRLKPGMDAIDLLRASFPGGSVTGAPKIRAMEIIRELEPSPRGVYCGCLGWIGFDGAMDMSMTIRTLTLAGDRVLAQAGGGIVADSDPAAEYEESMIKIAPLLRALAGTDR